MAHRVVWSPQALADVEAVAEYIEKDSPFYARAVVAKVVAATRHLGQYPLSGRVVPEKMDPAFREVFAFIPPEERKYGGSVKIISTQESGI